MRNLTPIKKKKTNHETTTDKPQYIIKLRRYLVSFLDLLFWLWKETLLAFEENAIAFVRQWAEATNDSCAQQN